MDSRPIVLIKATVTIDTMPDFDGDYDEVHIHTRDKKVRCDCGYGNKSLFLRERRNGQSMPMYHHLPSYP